MHPHAQATFEPHRSNLLESDLLYLSAALGEKTCLRTTGHPKVCQELALFCSGRGQSQVLGI